MVLATDLKRLLLSDSNVKTEKTGMTELAGMMNDLAEAAARCSGCGMCQAVCPVYGVTGREADVARGKLELLKGLVGGLFTHPRGVEDRLSRCLLCGSCAKDCPRGVDVMGLFLRARAIICAYQGLPLFQKILFRRVMTDPARFNRWLSFGAKWQHLVLRPSVPSPDASCARLVSPLLSDRRVVPLAAVPYHKMDKPLMDSGSGVRAAFFVGCLLDKVFPRIADRITKTLAACGVRLHIPEPQGCCGIPALSAGDTAAFQRMVRYHLDLFPPDAYDVLVTGCATCTAVIKTLWPVMPLFDADHEQETARRISEKTMDISQFLVDVIGLAPAMEKSTSRISITYHDPCHLKKTLGIFEQPRRLIKANPRYRFVETAGPDDCCGMGGSFSLRHYDLSMQIGLKKISAIHAAGVSEVATACPACLLQLTDLLSRSGRPVPVRHVIELWPGADE